MLVMTQIHSTMPRKPYAARCPCMPRRSNASITPVLAAPSASPHSLKWSLAETGRQKPNSAKGRFETVIAPSETTAISPWDTARLSHR